MFISVVVPTYNRAKKLVRCLSTLSEQRFRDYEIIVVDDGSSDDTPVVVRNFHDVVYIRQNNRGPAAARNLGLAHAHGEVVAFTDDDCVAPLDWLAQLESGYLRHPEVAGVGGHMEPPAEILRSNIFARYEWHSTRNTIGINRQEFVGGFECPAGGTNNMSYRRQALIEVGGFDESFPFAAGEDADLKWRICQREHHLLYIPVRVTHLHEYTWQSFTRQHVTRGKGAARFEEKWAQRPSRARILARLSWRFVIFWKDLATIETKSNAMLKLAAGVFDCLGQLQIRPTGGRSCSRPLGKG
ncbi:MAG: glycosyltransferase family 2 protein [Chloroflexi bacterium]|nr:glycosyltransferase family 2 protein [Chloroflexota bacterium]